MAYTINKKREKKENKKMKRLINFPKNVDEKLKKYVEENDTTFTQVIVTAVDNQLNQSRYLHEEIKKAIFETLALHEDTSSKT